MQTLEPVHMELHGDAILANRGLLRIEDVAVWLGIGRTKLYELINAGTMPTVRIGRCRRIAVSALDAFMEELIERGAPPQ